MKEREKRRFETIHQEGKLSVVKILVDTVTGVHYLYSWDGYSGGMTALLDENGDVVVDKHVIQD
ncbi:DUF6440 family protein [Sporosarcina aquimarina]|uniref:DUF6440 family protein n=1 Tax=Sporosarcina aquimarina TaxID=114975 RepID=A0ABU4G556_9BACL|nr:DUF6440 family protein [Sporosarcina aquimarina]MDW0111527.1 DUF6440 family protein [Sporosarcina aquimarina]